MAKKEEIKPLIYAGLSVPQLMIRQGKVYNQLPKLPEEFKFLKEYFVPINEYPKFKLKLNKEEKLKELSKQIRKALKAYKKRQEVN